MSTKRKQRLSETKRERGGGRSRRYLFFLIPLVLGMAVLGYVVTQHGEAATMHVGSIAPDFELKVVGPNGLTGETVKFSSFRGSVVFLEFMESWCPICQDVAPAIESIRWDYEPKGVVFISVAGTLKGANAESTAAFIREYETQWTYVLDSDNSVFSKYGVNATPTFFIVDKNGVIANTYKGVATTKTITSALDAALAG